MPSDNPLDPVRAAHEDAWIRQHEERLKAGLRERLRAERTQAALREAGVGDDELAGQLADLGFDHDTLPVLPMAPLLQVAWADGKIQDAERALLLEAARAQGIEAGSPAGLAFDAMLVHRPGPEFFDAAMSYLRALLAALDPAAAADARTGLLALSRHVAMAHGQIFGVLGTGVSATESEALKRITDHLERTRGDAAEALVRSAT